MAPMAMLCLVLAVPSACGSGEVFLHVELVKFDTIPTDKIKIGFLTV